MSDRAHWDELLSRVEQPHITQAWAYGEAKRAAASWRTRRVVFDAGGWRPRRLLIRRLGEPVALCQLLDKSFAGVTVASRLNRGPLFLDLDPAQDVIRDVYAALKGRDCRGRVPLVLAPSLPDSDEGRRMLSELGYRPRDAAGWVSDRVDLRPNEEQVHQQLHKEWRRLLRRAGEAGLEFVVCESAEDLEWIIEQHVLHMEEKRFAGFGPAFLRALRDAAARDDFVVTQVRRSGQRLGGLITFRFGKVAEGLVLWVGEEGQRLNAGRFLDWHTALEMKRRGCEWLDLGGKRAGATETFKAGMGGREYRLLNEWVVF